MDVNSIGSKLLQTLKTVEVLIGQANGKNRDVMIAMAQESVTIAIGLALQIANAPRAQIEEEEEEQMKVRKTKDSAEELGVCSAGDRSA